MDKELDRIEAHAEKLLTEHKALREENRTLHARVDALEADNRRLHDKLTQAIARVEALIARLPEREDV